MLTVAVDRSSSDDNLFPVLQMTSHNGPNTKIQAIDELFTVTHQMAPAAKSALKLPCWMDQDATGMEAWLSPDDIVLNGNPSTPPKRGGGAEPLTFRLMFIVAKRLDGSRCHLVRS